MQILTDNLGALALRWCGLAYTYAFLWIALVLFGRVLLLIPFVGEFLLTALGWLFFLLHPALALASAVLGLFAAVYVGLITRGPAREAMAGLLAMALSLAGAAALWHFFGLYYVAVYSIIINND